MLDRTTTITIGEPPLLGSPRAGDLVLLVDEALLEVARHAPGQPPTWRCVPAGTEGKLLGYRERDGESFAIVEMSLERRIVMYVRERKLACAPRRGLPEPPRRGLPRRVSRR